MQRYAMRTFEELYEFLSSFSDLMEHSPANYRILLEQEYALGWHQHLDPRLFDGGSELCDAIEKAQDRVRELNPEFYY